MQKSPCVAQPDSCRAAQGIQVLVGGQGSLVLESVWSLAMWTVTYRNYGKSTRHDCTVAAAIFH